MPPAVGAAPSQGLNKWSRPVASPSTSKPSEISVHSAESQPSIVAPAVRAAFPQGLNNWARPVAPPSKSKPSETSILNSNSPLSITPLPTRKVSHPKNKLTSLSPDSDHANSSPTLPEARAIGASLQRRNNWARPVAPPSSRPSLCPRTPNPAPASSWASCSTCMRAPTRPTRFPAGPAPFPRSSCFRYRPSPHPAANHVLQKPGHWHQDQAQTARNSR